jgi:hypothetical protein
VQYLVRVAAERVGLLNVHPLNRTFASASHISVRVDGLEHAEHVGLAQVA